MHPLQKLNPTNKRSTQDVEPLEVLHPFFAFENFKLLVRSHSLEQLNEIDNQFTDDLIQGKMLRSYLVFLLAKDLKLVNEQDMIKLASSIELMHEASLLHDDIEDGQRERRNNNTFWVEHGVNQAINMGDYILNSGLKPLLHLNEMSPLEAIQTYQKTVEDILKGQILEQKSLGKIINKNTYYSMIELKTGTLLKAPLYFLRPLMGIYKFENLLKAFHHLSRAYQIENDRLDFNLLENGQDFKNKIPTLPFLMLYEKSSLNLLSHKVSLQLMDQKNLEKINRNVMSQVKHEYQKFRYYCQLASKELCEAIEVQFNKYFNEVL